MAKTIWTQYRVIAQRCYIDINLDSVLQDNEGWTNYDTALKNCRMLKSSGVDAKVQQREVSFGVVKIGE